MSSKFSAFKEEIKALPKGYKIAAAGLTILLVILIIVCAVIFIPKALHKNDNAETSAVFSSESGETGTEIMGADSPYTEKTEKTTMPPSKAKTTTKPSTTKKAVSISKAYWDIVEEYEDDYGYFESSDRFVTGVCSLYLIDYDDDGVDELTLIYNTDSYSGQFKYDIWTYKNGSAVKVSSRKLRCQTYDMVQNFRTFTNRHTNKTYVYEVEDFDEEIVYGSLYTKEGDRLEEAYCLNLYDGRYRLDGEFFSQNDFEENEFISNYEDIGLEGTEEDIAFVKKCIAKMD